MSSKTKNWTEEDFRAELKRIDDFVRVKHGIDLCGSELEIGFSNSHRTLGVYYSGDMRFVFSLAFFNSNVPEECAIDVIRHEYAHYYTHAVFGIRGGHGAYFKAACKAVGAIPHTYYSRFAEEMARTREWEKACVYSGKLKEGDAVTHPKYGNGIVISSESGRSSALLTVEFEAVGEKKIDECWILKFGKVKRM